MALTKERKQELISTYGKNEKDTGNTDVQIAILTDRINYLTEHVKANPKDHHTVTDFLSWLGSVDLA